MLEPPGRREIRVRRVGRDLAVLAVFLLAACANPVPPTGGPTDATPPAIRVMTPAEGSVQVSADEVVIEFTEYVDEASFQRAFAITPAFSEPLDLAWRGRTVRIRFPAPLRPNTTYLLQIDTNLRDVHGVSLREPITVAFSTGARIDKGRITGLVRDAQDGAPVPGIDVFAYGNVRADTLSTLPPEPDYRTQTGADGRFTFLYLPEGATYYLVALADANRNRGAQPGERFAAPPDPAVSADTLVASGAEAIRFAAAVVDTIPPEPQRTRPISSRRVAVRFTEPVRLLSTEPWPVVDNTGSATGTAFPYIAEEERREVVLRMDSLSPGRYAVVPGAVADSAGNAALRAAVAFEITPAPDTVQVRFSGFRADTTAAGLLRPDAEPVVAFVGGIAEAEVRERLTVADSTGRPVSFDLRTETQTVWEVLPTGEAPAKLVLTVDDSAADSVFVQPFERLPASETGEISGVVGDADGPVVVEIYGAGTGDPLRVQADAQGRFRAALLPEGQYFLRVFADRDANGTWSSGALAPYRPPEPVTWEADSVRVRARWETALEDTIRFDAGPATESNNDAPAE